jgi:hypothetical protein
VPFIVITVQATLSGFDRTLIRAAEARASRVTTFRRVALPLILPGLPQAPYSRSPSFGESSSRSSRRSRPAHFLGRCSRHQRQHRPPTRPPRRC